MKRWISLFLSLVVVCSACMLSAFADELPNEYSVFVHFDAGSSASSLGLNASGNLSDRTIGFPGQYNYGSIPYFIIDIPSNSYFFFSFDIGATDLYNLDTSVKNVYLDTPTVYGPDQITLSNQYVDLYMVEVRQIRFVSGDMGIHFEFYGFNSRDDITYCNISFNTPVAFHTDSYSSNSGTKYYNFQILNSQSSLFIDLNSLQEMLDSYYDTWDTTYFPTINTFYNEFHQYWNTLVNTYAYNLYYYLVNRQLYVAQITYDNTTGIASFVNSYFNYPSGVQTSLNSIVRYLWRQALMENKAIQAGANDTYDDLNESASFGSLSDFAGAGSAASWSSGSFSEGLNGGFVWFSSATKDSLDTVPLTRAPSNIINAYDAHIAEYEDIIEEGN